MESSSLKRNSQMSISKRQTTKDKQDQRRLKQDLCTKLQSLEKNTSSSPDRVSRLYAML